MVLRAEASSKGNVCVPISRVRRGSGLGASGLLASQAAPHADASESAGRRARKGKSGPTGPRRGNDRRLDRGRGRTRERLCGRRRRRRARKRRLLVKQRQRTSRIGVTKHTRGGYDAGSFRATGRANILIVRRRQDEYDGGGGGDTSGCGPREHWRARKKISRAELGAKCYGITSCAYLRVCDACVSN